MLFPIFRYRQSDFVRRQQFENLQTVIFYDVLPDSPRKSKGIGIFQQTEHNLHFGIHTDIKAWATTCAGQMLYGTSSIF